MVRALVGTMVDVGRGYTMEQEFEGIMQSRDRGRAGMAAPAHGLVLEQVLY
jgi:tRNA pseudouridine38-40 synthase